MKAATHFVDGGKRFAVAVDGSEMAHKAFLEACKLMNKEDYIHIVHVADYSKSE